MAIGGREGMASWREEMVEVCAWDREMGMVPGDGKGWVEME
jgi:hypothetical protein